jgi:homocysteine S-methyltransferase
MYRDALPQLDGDVFLTDSGIETDLIFNAGFELPEFAAFVLLDDERGRVALAEYFQRHVEIAVRRGCGVILETPTWRASRDWGLLLGYDAAELRRVNAAAVNLVDEVGGEFTDRATAPVLVSGCIGPRADGYLLSERMTEDEARAYHTEQIEALATTAADLVHAMTLTYPQEAIGIARAAADVGVPVAISFTTETNGRLPDGTSLADAIGAVDRAAGAAPAYYGINCAHPIHFASALPGGQVGERIRSVRANASKLSHAEIDESPELDSGDPAELATDYARLRARHPSLTVLGGCCGTDTRHIEAIADAILPR